MMKPQLPPTIERCFPPEVLRHIYSFVPHLSKKRTQTQTQTFYTYSPNMERDLRRIQNTFLHGKSETYMKDLDDFIL